VDLYAWSGGTRADPGALAPKENVCPPPVRNGDAGNLALYLLGLEPMQGSMHQGLTIVPPIDAPTLLPSGACGAPQASSVPVDACP
jgi:hypothetical protein